MAVPGASSRAERRRRERPRPAGAATAAPGPRPGAGAAGRRRGRQRGEGAHQSLHADDAVDAGHHHHVGRAGQEAGARVAVLDVERSGLGLALEVGLGVGHDGRIGAPQRRDGGLERSWSQRGPVPVAPEPEQQVVAAVRAGPQVSARTWSGSGRPVRWSSTSSCRPGTTSPLSWSRARLASRAASTSATRPPLAGSAPAPGRCPWRPSRCPCRPAPTTVTRRPCSAVGAVPVSAAAAALTSPPPRSTGLACSRRTARMRVAVDRLGEHGDGAQLDPPPPARAAGDDHRRAPDPAGLLEQVSVETRAALVDDHGRPRPPGGEAGPDLVGRHAADELHRKGGRGGPAADLGEPGRPGPGGAQHDVVLARHGARPASDGATVVDGTGGAGGARARRRRRPSGAPAVMTATCEAWATSTTWSSDASPTVSTRPARRAERAAAGLLHVEHPCPPGQHDRRGVGAGAEGRQQVDLLARAHIAGEGPLAVHGEGELGAVGHRRRRGRTEPAWTSSPAPIGPRVTAPISGPTSAKDGGPGRAGRSTATHLEVVGGQPLAGVEVVARTTTGSSGGPGRRRRRRTPPRPPP